MLKAIEKHTGVVLPLNRSHVDTDQIIPKQFLKSIKRTGFGQFLFYHWRFDDDGNERSDFVLNAPQFSDATILLTGENFGCGSSREHAPWALMDYGFKVVIAPSYADIFYNNALKNGMVPVILDETIIQDWMKEAVDGKLTLTVDLQEQHVCDQSGKEVPFDIPAYHKEKLINGWDDIALTLHHEDKITQYEHQSTHA